MLRYRNKNAKEQFSSNLTWCIIELKIILNGNYVFGDLLPFLGNINGNLKTLVIYIGISIFIIYKKKLPCIINTRFGITCILYCCKKNLKDFF